MKQQITGVFGLLALLFGAMTEAGEVTTLADLQANGGITIDAAVDILRPIFAYQRQED